MTFDYVRRTTDGLVKTGPGIIRSVILTAGSGATGTIDIYDETSASGDVILSLSAVQATSVVAAPLNVAFGVGCYIDITGAGASCTVMYT